MIQDIPNAEDFKINGVSLLNIAWESIVGISLKHEHISAAFEDDADEEELSYQQELSEQYWLDVQRELALAVALAQQGAEFLLKGKICSISPFLLIVGEPGKWPRGCDKEDRSFSEFRTVDAIDLVKIHDTVMLSRLSAPFKTRFEMLRSLRNTVMHSVSKHEFSTKDALLSILQIADTLIGSRCWLSERRLYLRNRLDIAAALGYESFQICRIALELQHVFSLLDPKDTAQFFDFHPKQRTFYCPECACNCADTDDSLEPLAQLRPNRPASTTIYCLVCESELTVSRKSCSDKPCKGNVISMDYNQCLTCLSYQDD